MYRIEDPTCISRTRRGRLRAIRFACFVSIALVLPGHVVAQSLSLTTVVVTGDPAPGTITTFSGFIGNGALDDAGHVAFAGRIPTGQGIWRQSPLLAKVAITGDPAPGTAATFSLFPGAPAIGAQGTAFFATLNAGGQGIWIQSPALGKVAVTGEAAPGTATTFSGFRVPAINDLGHAAIGGRLTGGGQGVWKQAPALGKVAVVGDAAPGTAVTFSLLDDSPLINALDHTAFTGSTSLGGGIWKESPALGKVALAGDAAPGTTSTFAAFGGGALALNDLDHTAFVGFLSTGGVTGIWKESPALGKVAVVGDLAPGTTATFSGFRDAPFLNAADHVAFYAQLTGGDEGIWAEDPSGVLKLVARSGTTIEVRPGDSRTIRSLLLAGFNDSGQVAFRADFFGGSEGIFVASFQPPAPVTITISGTTTTSAAAALPGVTMALAGSAVATTTTSATGQYSFTNLAAGGTYTVTPGLSGRVFEPATRTFSNVTTNQTADFVGRGVFTISGGVRDLLESGVPDVLMTLSGSSSTTTVTDADGNYVFSGLAEGGSFTVTPSKTEFVFSPPSQSFPNLQKDEVASFFIATLGKFTRYFAEGAASAFFDTRIALLNATGTPATAKVTFLTAALQKFEKIVPLAGIQRISINPKELTGFPLSAEFSTVIESDQPIIADRTMEWSDFPSTPSTQEERKRSEYGMHAETSVAAPQTIWYLAEGATIAGFNLFYLLQNATTTDAQVQVKYLLPFPQPPVVKTYTVRKQSRFNIWVNLEDPQLDDAELSAVIESLNGVPIIVERAMYLDTGGKTFRAGHESAAVPGPALEWFLAEGATGPFFDLFVLIANPNAEAASISAEFLLPDGRVVTRHYDVAGLSRFNIWVDIDPELSDTAVSTTVRSTNGVPIIVERAMWWPTDPGHWYEGHNSAGALRAGTKWGLADGELAATEEVYVLVANTSTFAGQARVILTFEDGGQATRTFNLAPTSRFNVDVRSEFPSAVGRRFGVIVESLGSPAAELIVERAMYHDANGVFWDAGSNVVGTRLR